MIEFHGVPADRFAGLASGLGGPAAVDELATVQRSKHLLLLRFLSDASAGDDAARHATDVLIQAERRDPRAVAVLMSDPLVGAWAVRTARRLLGQNRSRFPVSVDLAQLGSLAAVAAVRTGLDAELHTCAPAGVLTLPTLGGARLGSADHTTTDAAPVPVVVTVSAGQAVVGARRIRVAITGEDDRWWPLRRLVAQHGDLVGSLAVEDGNPYRDGYHAPAADRLSPGEADRWQDLFSEAWDLLGGFVPERAAELAAGLRSVVPLVTGDDGVAKSGTARDTFGTLGLTRPRSGVELAVTLVHEFQHSKLSALLDLVSLHRRSGGERHFAPWRVDARPTGGLLQGIYAFLGVADTWRALRSAPGLETQATTEFAVVRRQVEVGLSSLESSAELTVKGQEFAARLRTALDRLMAEPVPAAAAAEATAVLARRRRAWNRHNSDIATSTSVPAVS